MYNAMGRTKKIKAVGLVILFLACIYALNSFLISGQTTRIDDGTIPSQSLHTGDTEMRAFAEKGKMREVYVSTMTSRTTKLTTSHTPELPPTINTDFMDFLEICSGVLKLIVLDPAILRTLQNRDHTDHPLPALSRQVSEQSPFDVLTLGIWEPHTVYFDQVLKKLSKQGFNVKIRLAQDFRSHETTDYHSSIKTTKAQYIIYRSIQTCVQVVILFERDHFIWTPAISLNGEYKSTLEKAYFVESRAFDRFNLSQSTLANSIVYTPADISKYIWELPTSRFIECNYTQVRSFREKHDKHNNLTLRMDSIKMEQIVKGLVEVKTQMVSLRKSLFLAAGTLLGWGRQCGVISFTQDVDTGIFYSEYDVSVTKAFLGNKVAGLRMRLGKLYDSLELRLLAGPIAIDIFALYEQIDTYWMGGHFYWQGNYTRYKVVYPKFSLCSCNFIGHRFNIPCEVNTILSVEYGPKWYEPRQNWGINDPLNFKWNGVWLEDDLPKVHQIFDD